MEVPLSTVESGFAARAVRRKRLFLALSVAGLAVAGTLSVYYVWRRTHDPTFIIGARSVIIVLILLNARQNLRQYRYACLIEKLLPSNR